jgi:hypothetical protein
MWVRMLTEGLEQCTQPSREHASGASELGLQLRVLGQQGSEPAQVVGERGSARRGQGQRQLLRWGGRRAEGGDAAGFDPGGGVRGQPRAPWSQRPRTRRAGSAIDVVHSGQELSPGYAIRLGRQGLEGALCWEQGALHADATRGDDGRAQSGGGGEDARVADLVAR